MLSKRAWSTNYLEQSDKLRKKLMSDNSYYKKGTVHTRITCHPITCRSLQNLLFFSRSEKKVMETYYDFRKFSEKRWEKGCQDLIFSVIFTKKTRNLDMLFQMIPVGLTDLLSLGEFQYPISFSLHFVKKCQRSIFQLKNVQKINWKRFNFLKPFWVPITSRISPLLTDHLITCRFSGKTSYKEMYCNGFTLCVYNFE